MLIGSYQTTLAENGRCALPAKFRKELGDKAVVARWYEGCLVIVKLTALQELLHRVTGESKTITGSVRDTDRFLLGSAYEVELDVQGRFVLSKELRDYAKLSESVVFVGLGDRVEIWSVEAWTKQEQYVAEHASEMVELLSKNGG